MRLKFNNISQAYKILISMLFFILFIQLGTLLYIWQIQTKVLLENETKNLRYQLEIDANLLVQKMKKFQQELNFLGTLEVMDDVVVGDVDKRILTLLEKKSKDLTEGIVLEAFHHKKLVATTSRGYDENNYLHFSVNIFSSFNPASPLGHLTLLYPLENLKKLKKKNPYQQLWLTPLVSQKSDNRIVVSMPLEGVLKEFKLFLSYEKEYALKSIKKIEQILVLSFLLSLVALLIVVWVLFKKQINILENTQDILALKRTFLSTMSHELRTPLGSILNLTQHLMISSKVGDSEVEMLGKIENASEHLLEMINNLLQLSKLESNSMNVIKEEVDIIVLIEEMVELIEPLIDEKELGLEKEFNLDNSLIVTDINLFKQVIINLLSNAVKYTQEGSIRLLLEEKNGLFEFTVVDTGIGIDLAKQKALFLEFYQAHSQEVKHSSGLGLALSQKVAKLIEGEILIKSRGVGFGTKALFRFHNLQHFNSKPNSSNRLNKLRSIRKFFT